MRIAHDCYYLFAFESVLFVVVKCLADSYSNQSFRSKERHGHFYLVYFISALMATEEFFFFSHVALR